MIVKCQRAISWSQEKPPILVYNQSRSFEQMIPYSDLWESLFETFGLENYMKAKFFAEVHEDRHILVIDKPLTKDLGW